MMLRGPDEYERNSHLKVTCRACGCRFYEEEGACDQCGDDQYSEPEDDGDGEFDEPLVCGPNLTASEIAARYEELEFSLRHTSDALSLALASCLNPIVSTLATELHCEARPFTDDMRAMMDDLEAAGVRLWPLPRPLHFLDEKSVFYVGYDLASGPDVTGYWSYHDGKIQLGQLARTASP